MDPNAALKRLRELMKSIADITESMPDEDRPELDELVEEASEVVDVFDGLDSWMSKGGFLPEDWNKNRKKSDG